MENDKRMVDDKKTDRGRILTGMFADRASTQHAYDDLHKRGYNKDDIHLVMSEETRKKSFPADETDLGQKASDGFGKGSLIGGAVGATVGIIAALGTSVLLPGLGLVIAGPLAAGLAGAGAGGVAGGLIGALANMGVPKDRAEAYESGVKQGKIVMGVHPKNEEDAKYFQTDWNSKKAEQIHY